MPDRLPAAVRAVLAGALICFSLPPWGWWPLAILGVALWDDLIADAGWRKRFGRTWLVCVAWLGPGMVWMWDMTPPGYLLATVTYAGYFAVGAAVAPGGRWRVVALPAAVVVAELSRWSFPFGGVPLATLPQSQVASPWAFVVRVGGPLLLAALTVVLAQGVRAVARGHRRQGALAVGALVLVGALGAVAPSGSATGTLDVAAVQGGGEQRTRATDTSSREVFERHLAASELVRSPVDLVLWPENVVNVSGTLDANIEQEELAELARRLDATLVVGIVESISDTEFLNAALVFDANGDVVDRFDKVRTVPFGEFVPLRSIIERLNSEVPGRDARAGSGPGVLDTPAGRFGVVISWEAFFANRGRSGIAEGGEALLNPTNGSSYWLTMVQTQQVASLRLRALETGRWVVEASPTGFTSVVRPDGTVLQRTDVSERAVVHATIELRTGDTLYVRYGDWPMLLAALGALVACRVPTVRSRFAQS